MNRTSFPWIAMGLGIVCAGFVAYGNLPGPDGYTALPLLALLVVAEFAFIVNAIAVYIAARDCAAHGVTARRLVQLLFCGVAAIYFAINGIALWPV